MMGCIRLDKFGQAAVALLILIILSGCSGALHASDDEQDNAPTLVLNNTANSTHSFSVWAVEGAVNKNGLRIVPRDQEPYNFTPSGQLWTSHFPEGTVYIESIQPPPNRSRIIANISLQANSTHQQRIENFSIGDTIVVTIAENGRIFELTVVNCGRHPLVGVGISTRPEPAASASYGCR